MSDWIMTKIHQVLYFLTVTISGISQYVPEYVATLMHTIIVFPALHLMVNIVLFINKDDYRSYFLQIYMHLVIHCWLYLKRGQ